MRRANKYPIALSRSRVFAAAALALLASATASAAGFDFGFGSAGNGSSKCFLSGSIRPLNAGSSKKGFQSLENRLRLNFDADDPQTCERYLKSYCHNNILGKGDVPVKLKAYFRPARTIASEEDKKPTHTYEITEACKIVVE